MPVIKLLPDHVINKIAAGEVVERPASVVKELVENSLDAGADDIRIDIEQAGSRLIRIVDNGCGMSREDARIAFLRHATSKIADDADLDAIRTMGFRGEALSSIASVSRVRLLTAERGAVAGVEVRIEPGGNVAMIDAAAPQGTTLEIANLFFNTPARLKFLKSPATEFSHILSVVSRTAMAFSAVHFRLTHNGKEILELPSTMKPADRVYQLYGADLADNLFSFDSGAADVRIHGFLGKPSYSRADKTYQEFYVNHRSVRNASLSHALFSAYAGMLMRDRYPVGIIFVDIDPALVDVNVHPAKSEVRFRNQQQLHDFVRNVIRDAVGAHRGGDATSGHADRVREVIAEYLARPHEPANMRTRPGYPAPVAERTTTDPSAMIHAEAEQIRIPEQISGMPAHGLFPIGQVHDSFIIAQTDEGMAVIDQHAAHERVLFERLQQQMESSGLQLQSLLLPIQIELGVSQVQVLSEQLAELHALGMQVEYFGGGTFLLKAIPALLVGGDYKRLLIDMLDELGAHGGAGRFEAHRDEILSVMACHPAIKVHHRLSRMELEQLIDDLYRCKNPHTCPHGRPTVIRFSMHDMKKMFKRV